MDLTYGNVSEWLSTSTKQEAKEVEENFNAWLDRTFEKHAQHLEAHAEIWQLVNAREQLACEKGMRAGAKLIVELLVVEKFEQTDIEAVKDSASKVLDSIKSVNDSISKVQGAKINNPQLEKFMKKRADETNDRFEELIRKIGNFSDFLKFVCFSYEHNQHNTNLVDSTLRALCDDMAVINFLANDLCDTGILVDKYRADNV